MSTGSPTLSCSSTIIVPLLLILTILMSESMSGPIRMLTMRGIGGCISLKLLRTGHMIISTMPPTLATAPSMLVNDPLAITSWISPQETMLGGPGSSMVTTSGPKATLRSPTSPALRSRSNCMPPPARASTRSSGWDSDSTLPVSEQLHVQV